MSRQGHMFWHQCTSPVTLLVVMRCLITIQVIGSRRTDEGLVLLLLGSKATRHLAANSENFFPLHLDNECYASLNKNMKPFSCIVYTPSQSTVLRALRNLLVSILETLHLMWQLDIMCRVNLSCVQDSHVYWFAANVYRWVMHSPIASCCVDVLSCRWWICGTHSVSDGVLFCSYENCVIVWRIEHGSFFLFIIFFATAGDIEKCSLHDN